MNFRSSFVIELGEARKWLRPGGLGEGRRPKILETLDRAEEWQRRLDAGGVKRADLAREHGVSRARGTQILKLLRLDPVLLDWVRAHPARVVERKLRPLLGMSPEAQRAAGRASGFGAAETG